jgi:glycosyltransferase involved in cell wall biosynthesis
MVNIAFGIGNFEKDSGIVRVVINIAVELAKKEDYNVSIITPYFQKQNFESKLHGVHIHITELGFYPEQQKKYLLYCSALRKVLKENPLDVIVLSGTELVWQYSLAAFRTSSDAPRLIVWEHRNFGAGPKFRLEWFGKRIAAKYWDGILCITKRDYAQYAKYLKDTRKLYQIYNLTDFSVTRKEYQEESKKIISCGYLAHIKGFDMLVEVAAGVFEKHPDWTWDIYGEGAERENIQKKIEAYHLGNNLFLKGYTDNINELYGKYSFFVLTSRAEGMGMVLIEAQKSGLPCVSFDILCGPSDVITDGKNGYLVPPFSIQTMIKRINTLIENQELRKSFSENSERNLEEFRKDIIVEKWIAMLENKTL